MKALKLSKNHIARSLSFRREAYGKRTLYKSEGCFDLCEETVWRQEVKLQAAHGEMAHLLEEGGESLAPVGALTNLYNELSLRWCARLMMFIHK